jgi:hypothetical protein
VRSLVVSFRSFEGSANKGHYDSKLAILFLTLKQRDELVLRKQAELNIIQKKAKVKKKFDGYDEALKPKT